MPRPLLPGALLATGLLLLAARPASAQIRNRVANYAIGQPGTASYEHFSFWTKNGQRNNLQYSYGAKRTDVSARYVGPTRLRGRPGFRVRLAGGRLLYLLPSGNALQVSASPAASPKTFTWEYEGPVNGVGTVCSVCVPDAAAAVRLLRRSYL